MIVMLKILSSSKVDQGHRYLDTHLFESVQLIFFKRVETHYMRKLLEALSRGFRADLTNDCRRM